MDPLFEAKVPDDREELVSPVAASVQQPPPPQPQRAMRRENDSMDDFEHLEHDGSQLDEAPSGALDVTSVQLIDLPRAAPSGVSDLMDVASKLERNILDTSIPVDERILQPVPATPPPSASFEKFDEPPGGAGREAHALHHRFDGQQDEAGRSRYSDQRFDESPREDAKAATMAFMETERAIGDYHGGSVDRRPEDELGAEVATQRAVDGPAGDPVSMEDYRTREHELGVNSTVVENEPESSSGKARLAPDKSAADVDELLAGADDHRPSSDDIAYESSGVESACRLPSAGEAAKMQTLGFAHGESKRSSDYDFLGDDGGAPGAAIGKSESSRNVVDDDTWNVVEKPELQKRSSTAMFVGREADETAKVERELFEAPTKPLPPLPKAELDDEDEDRHFAARNERVNDEKFVMSDDFMTATETSGPRGQKSRGQQQQQQQSGAETGDSEFESAPEQSPAKSSTRTAGNGGGHHVRKINADDIAPKEIFAQMGLDAWFNPERLNPKVAALIYWRQPEKTGIVFGAVLGVLLSLAYFSLISVFAYLSLLTLTGTVGFRVYKTFMQAVQKTSDGHPFKDILEVELTLPSEKVHEVADVAVAHANAAVAELRRLFLVEDFIDSLKFGVVLWCFTYLGSWFNGMTLIIIGVVALFTLPKVYETNKAQIDQNVALVHGKINELTAKVKAAIPLGKKAEPTKEE